MQKKRKTVAAQMKADAAIARRNALKAMREAAAGREAEGPKSRAALKREEAANKRAEAIARKAKTRRLEEEGKIFLELQETTSKKKTTGDNVNKMTRSESWWEEVVEQAKKAEEFKRRASRTVSEKEYEKMVLAENTNADRWTVEVGLSALSIDSTPLTTRLETFEKADPDRRSRIKHLYNRQPVDNYSELFY